MKNNTELNTEFLGTYVTKYLFLIQNFQSKKKPFKIEYLIAISSQFYARKSIMNYKSFRNGFEGSYKLTRT